MPPRSRRREGPAPWRRSAALRAAAVVAFAAVLVEGGCGKKGVPQPPLQVRPAPVASLKARQRGEKVVVTLQEPRKRTDGTSFEEQVVLRLTMLTTDEAIVPARRGRRGRQAPSAQPAGAVSWVVPREEWAAYRVEKRLEIPLSISSLDLKPSSGSTSLAGRRVSFLAEVQEGKRKKSPLVPPVSLALCDAPAPPSRAEARIASSGIAIGWSGGSGGGVVHLYRAQGNAPFPDLPYRTLPSSTRSYLDAEAAPGTEYRYLLRFGAGEDPLRCESASSEEVSVTYVDLFPPAPPTGLAAAAEETLIRLFWTPGMEPDLAGYFVYRSDGPDQPFRRLTLAPISTTTYADTDVRSGVRYRYVVSAIDAAQPPNESNWSTPAEEALP